MQRPLIAIAVLALVGLAYFGFKPSSTETSTAEMQSAAEPRGSDSVVTETPSASPLSTEDNNEQATSEENNATADASAASLEENQNLQTLLRSESGFAILKTEAISALSVSELTRHINGLDSEGVKDSLSYDAERRLDTWLRESPHLQHAALQCAETLCGMLFSAQDHDQVVSTLDELARDERLKDISRGGILRRIEDAGTHYGLYILVLDRGEPLSLR